VDTRTHLTGKADDGGEAERAIAIDRIKSKHLDSSELAKD
jgi:hypothetical protein